MNDTTVPTRFRDEETNGRVRTALGGAIKGPVKEAVREALAEGTHEPTGPAAGDGPETVDPTDTEDGRYARDAEGTTPSDGGSETADDDSSSSWFRRSLGPRLVVGLVGIVVVAYLRLRRSRDGDADAE